MSMTARGLMLVQIAQKQSNEQSSKEGQINASPPRGLHSPVLSCEKTRKWINSHYFCGTSNQTGCNKLQEKNSVSNESSKEYVEVTPVPLVSQTASFENERSSPGTVISSSQIDDSVEDPDFESKSEDSSSTSVGSAHSEQLHERITLPNQEPILLTIPSSAKKRLVKQNHGKKAQCKYCEIDVVSKNFVRHLERHHKEEIEVQKILQQPKNSKDRRLALGLLRKDTNFELFINGTTRPVRELKREGAEEYFPCVYCKGLFLKNYLKRHGKSCLIKKQTYHSSENSKKEHYLANSQTLIACAMDPTNVISKMNVKEQVFNIMKADKIAFEAKKDLLIAHMAESYLKKHKREGMAYAASNKMRELSRLLIVYRRLVNNENLSFTDIIHPRNFDTIVMAAREISGYDHEKKTFKAPSLAMHLGTSLKLVCDELIHLVLRQSKGYKTKSTTDKTEWIQNIKFFKELVESRWNTELASLANKDLCEKRWNKPSLLPLVSDIKKFRDGVLKIANECKEQLIQSDKNEHAYKLFVQSVLALLILFNRRRIGDVQYLKIKEYLHERRTNLKDFEKALTETEIVLTKQYKRVINSGKGNRVVVILVPSLLQDFLNALLEHRSKYLPPDNEYVFAVPGSTIRWGKGDVAIKSLCKQIKLEHPEAISSNKLRKHIATVMQILNLSKDESKQFATFMGHTQKTHDEFYELPVDIYQTAKVSKLLLMIEKGSVPVEYKGKSLADIDIEFEFPEEDNDGDMNEGVLFLEDDDGNHVHGRPDNNDKVEDNAEENIQDKYVNSDKSSERDEPTCNETVTQNKERDRKESVIANEEPTCSSYCKETVTEKQKRVRKHSVSSSNDSFSDEAPTKPRKNKCKKNKRQGWTNGEVHLIREQFKTYIINKVYPSGKEMKNFLAENNLNKPVPLLRSKIQHLMKLK